MALNECPSSSQVGLITIWSRYEEEPEFLLGTAPVYALVPAPGQFGALGFMAPIVDEEVVAQVSLREATDYGTRLTLAELPQSAPISRVHLTMWGVPAGGSHDLERFPRGSPGNPPGCPGLEDASCIGPPVSSNAPLIPFTLNPTHCSEPLAATLAVQTYQDLEATTRSEAPYPQMTGCDQLSFNPSLSAAPTSTVAYSPTGLKLDLYMPQQQSPSVPAPSELRSVLVRLPEAVWFNPAPPEKAVACSDAEAALGSEEPAACPEEALLGTARVELPVVAESLVGEIYLGIPASEDEERLLVIVEGAGIELKLPMSLSEDPETGQLQLALAQPQLPIANYDLHLFGGPEAIFRTPLYCGTYPVSAAFTPWDQAIGTQTSTQFFEISSGPGGGPCLGEAKNVSVKLSPEAILADGRSQTKATVRITDTEGAEIPEEEVKLTSSDPAERVGEVTDQEDGTYTATITSSTTPGTATITASDLSTEPSLSGSATLTQWSTAPPPSSPPIQPQVSFSAKPPRRGHGRRPRFAFSANVVGASFSCKLDRAPYHPCHSPLRLPKLTIGAHRFAVRATTAAGTGSPAVWQFRVLGHRHRFHSAR